MAGAVRPPLSTVSAADLATLTPIANVDALRFLTERKLKLNLATLVRERRRTPSWMRARCHSQAYHPRRRLPPQNAQVVRERVAAATRTGSATALPPGLTVGATSSSGSAVSGSDAVALSSALAAAESASAFGTLAISAPAVEKALARLTIRHERDAEVGWITHAVTKYLRSSPAAVMTDAGVEAVIELLNGRVPVAAVAAARSAGVDLEEAAAAAAAWFQRLNLTRLQKLAVLDGRPHVTVLLAQAIDPSIFSGPDRNAHQAAAAEAILPCLRYWLPGGQVGRRDFVPLEGSLERLWQDGKEEIEAERVKWEAELGVEIGRRKRREPWGTATGKAAVSLASGGDAAGGGAGARARDRRGARANAPADGAAAAEALVGASSAHAVAGRKRKAREEEKEGSDAPAVESGSGASAGAGAADSSNDTGAGAGGGAASGSKRARKV